MTIRSFECEYCVGGVRKQVHTRNLEIFGFCGDRIRDNQPLMLWPLRRQVHHTLIVYLEKEFFDLSNFTPLKLVRIIVNLAINYAYKS